MRSPVSHSIWWRWCQLRRYILVAIAALLLALWFSNAYGQSEAASSNPAENPSPQIRSGVERLAPVLPPEIRELVNSTSATPTDAEWQTVWFNGRRLLRVAAITDNRANTIERQIESLAARDFDPSTVRVIPEEVGNLTVLVATAQLASSTDESDGAEDGASPETLSSELLTVTLADARRLGYDLGDFDLNSRQDVVAALARSWASKIQRSLVRFKLERQSRFLLQQLQIACAILLGLIILSMSARRPKRRLDEKESQLGEERRAIAQRIADEPDDASIQFPLVQEDTRLQHQQSVSLFKKRVIQIGELALWISGCFVIFGLFPYSRWLQVLLLEALRIPGKLLAVVLVTYLLIRLDDILIDRLCVFLQQTPRFLIHDSQRRALRFSTFSAVAKSIATVIFVAAGVVVALWTVGVNIGPLIAGAGILGLAVSFAAQSLIRDIINGFLILLEDQYGVGDVVILGEVAGFVENMGLRVTQLRNEEGRLITVPNGAISIVQNLTKEWSRVDLTVDVSYTADIDRALEVINTVAQDLDRDPEWDSIILEPPMVLGVDQLTHAGATIRLWIKTLPLKQWDVAREYRRRLKIAFDKAGIDIGTPHQAIRFDGQLSNALLQPGAPSTTADDAN